VQGPGVAEGGVIVTVGTVGQLLAAVAVDAASARAPKVMRGAGYGPRVFAVLIQLMAVGE
jgi:hypothetical protein